MLMAANSALEILCPLDSAASMSQVHCQSCIGRGGGDQLDDDLMADERLAAPVLGDIGEQSVLDAVPFASAGRQMGDRYSEARFAGEALEFTFPQMNAGAVAAAAISV